MVRTENPPTSLNVRVSHISEMKPNCCLQTASVSGFFSRERKLRPPKGAATRLPIDTVAVQFMSAGLPEPVLDFETRAPKLDTNGQPIYSVHLFAISPDSYDT
jgi:hypothetical protein